MKYLNLSSIFMNAILNYEGGYRRLSNSSYFVNSKGQIVLSRDGKNKKHFFITLDKDAITVDCDSYSRGKSLLIRLNEREEITEVKLGESILNDETSLATAHNYVAAVAKELLFA